MKGASSSSIMKGALASVIVSRETLGPLEREDLDAFLRQSQVQFTIECLIDQFAKWKISRQKAGGGEAGAGEVGGWGGGLGERGGLGSASSGKSGGGGINSGGGTVKNENAAGKRSIATGPHRLLRRRVPHVQRQSQDGLPPPV
jgi:hypothetical protein